MVVMEQPESFEKKAVIKVCGVGGGGGNAVNRMIESGLSDVDFIAINTDAMDLKNSLAPTRLQIGRGRGLGAGAKPEVGRQSCEEDRDRVRSVIEGADMVFLTLGLGGGTGTGASPIVAEEAAASGALVVAIVTLPFSYEGRERMDNALAGLEELEKYVDSLIVVPNDRLAELSDTDTRFLDAFRKGDEVLHNGVRAISELITVPGLINVDFADVRTVMEARGRALMGIGVAEGTDRSIRAAQDAIVCPLLEQSDIQGARGVIINVRGGRDMLIHEVFKANEYIKSNIGHEAKIITGAVVDEEERPEIQITVIAAGFPKKDPAAYTRPFVIVESKPAVAPIPFIQAKPPVTVKEEPKAPVDNRPKTTKPAVAGVVARMEKPSASPGQRELPLNASAQQETPAREKMDIKMPAFMRRALEKKQKDDDGSVSKTTSTRGTT